MSMTIMATDVDDIDRVLSDFATACPIPSASQLADWCAKHPALAPAMRDYAEVARENFDAGEDEPGLDPKLDAIFDRVLADGMRRIQAEPRPTLPEMIKARGTTIPDVAEAVGIDRGVLADIVAGRLMPPVGSRLVAALASALGTAQQAIREAVMGSFEAPRVGFASSDPQTAVRPRTWAESVAASDMDGDRKAHWLGED